MSVSSKQKLLAKLRNKEYRDAYVVEHVKTSAPIQIRTLREQHGFTQSELARRAGMTQTVISRLEDPNYGNLTINSLLKIASGLDVALLVKFVPFSRLLDEFKDVSPEAIAAESFEQEINKLEQWADNNVNLVTASATLTGTAVITAVGHAVWSGSGYVSYAPPDLQVVSQNIMSIGGSISPQEIIRTTGYSIPEIRQVA